MSSTNDFLIELQAKLDETKSKGNINADIDKLQTEVDKLKLQAEIDPAAISKLVKQMETVLKQKITISDIGIDQNKAVKAGQEVGQKIKGGIEQGLNINSDFTSKLTIAKNDLEKFKADAREFPQILKTVTNLDNAITNVGDASSLKSFNDQLKAAKSELSKLKSETNAVNRSEKTGINISRLQAKIADLQRISPEIDNFKAKINGTDVTVQSLLEDLATVNTQGDFSVVNSKFSAFKNAAKSAGIATTEFGSIIKKQFEQAKSAVLNFLSIGSGITLLISKFKESLTELKEVDTLLTEISKANDKLSKSDLKNIGSNSFSVASKYGKKSVDYLSAVQEASRAGYTNAESIAELSVAAQGAGDMTADMANKYIIATDKAYKLGGSVEELTKVLDGSNYISNNYAANMAGIAEGMSIVGSTAASFGVGVDKTTSVLATMMAATQQSGSEVARAYKAILLNIRQVSDNWLLPSNQFAPYVQKCA